MVGDLHKLPDVVAVREQGGSRLVCLLPGSQIQQSPLGFSHSKEGSSSTSGSLVVFEELEYHEPVCRQHYTQDFRLVTPKLHHMNGVSVIICVVQCKMTACGFVFCLLVTSEADFDPDSYKMPYVVMALSKLSLEVHSLLESHDGTLPMLR